MTPLTNLFSTTRPGILIFSMSKLSLLLLFLSNFWIFSISFSENLCAFSAVSWRILADSRGSVSPVLVGSWNSGSTFSLPFSLFSSLFKRSLMSDQTDLTSSSSRLPYLTVADSIVTNWADESFKLWYVLFSFFAFLNIVKMYSAKVWTNYIYNKRSIHKDFFKK